MPFPARPSPVPHHEPYNSDKLFTVINHQARPDAHAAGDGGDRRHRHPVRAGLDPGDLRPHAEHVIVFTATAFSLLSACASCSSSSTGLLDRLVYLGYGLAAILGFIGVKLVLHALHENNVPFINDGEPVEVTEIGTGLSLSANSSSASW